MKKQYDSMTANECAKHFIRSRRKLFLVYILALIAIGSIHLAATLYILPLYFGDEDSVRIYEGLSRGQVITTAILFILCIIIAIIALIVQRGLFAGIYLNQCDPEKYIEAENIVCKKIRFGHRNKRQKCQIAGAYAAFGDYDGAWNIYRELVPDNLDNCNDVVILGGLASYYYNVKNNEESVRYLSRLEAIKKSGKKRGSGLNMTIDHIKSVIAIDEKNYDEAKVLIDKYIDVPTLTGVMKAVNNYNLGLIAYETGNYVEAVYRFKVAVNIGGKLSFIEDATEKLAELEKKLAA
ncbi:tetratricopeptide repeat protein [Butyrivibrio sp. JL13D10]|uniref:tetratricopeptide repeat protein n=1 Tax=Butyrivibrio sp. JL13D10 TaxID=3236815 RepID=UPI0038B5F887